MPTGRARRALSAVGWLLTVAAVACASAAPAASAPAAPRTTLQQPAAETGTIAPTAFGMHYLRYGEVPWPDDLAFGSMRVSDMWVRWTDLQPKRTTMFDYATNGVVQRLDGIVASARAYGAQPLIVLGGTPTWAATACPHGTWPVATCGPKSTGMTSPWAAYVRFLAKRYSPAWFETWNEPNLRNGWNDTTRRLAALQKTAYTIIRNANPQNRLLSPSVAITAGHPLRYLRTLFGLPGGKSFDVFAAHLYPSDAAAKAGNGPEWAVDFLNHQLRPLLRRNGIGTTVWDTEANVGRTYMGISFTGLRGAAMVTRTYVLQLSNRVSRVYWYAADDRHWTGTALLQDDLVTMTAAGHAYNFTQRMLVGARVRGCTHTTTPSVVTYTCKFTLPTGQPARVLWTTKGHRTIASTLADKHVYDPVGRGLAVSPGTLITVTGVPTWIVG